MKRGWKTSEFWVVMFGVVLSTYMVETGKINSEQWMQTFGILFGGYAVSRGFAKFGNQGGE